MTERQQELYARLAAVYPKGLLLETDDRRTAGSMNNVEWLGFGNIRVYRLTELEGPKQ